MSTRRISTGKKPRSSTLGVLLLLIFGAGAYTFLSDGHNRSSEPVKPVVERVPDRPFPQSIFYPEITVGDDLNGFTVTQLDIESKRLEFSGQARVQGQAQPMTINDTAYIAVTLKDENLKKVPLPSNSQYSRNAFLIPDDGQITDWGQHNLGMIDVTIDNFYVQGTEEFYNYDPKAYVTLIELHEFEPYDRRKEMANNRGFTLKEIEIGNVMGNYTVASKFADNEKFQLSGQARIKGEYKTFQYMSGPNVMLIEPNKEFQSLLPTGKINYFIPMPDSVALDSTGTIDLTIGDISILICECDAKDSISIIEIHSITPDS